jgi:peptidylprolyl isomerase
MALTRLIPAALLAGAATVLSASSQSRPPLSHADIDDIARLVMLEDTRQFDEGTLAGLVHSQHPEVRRRAIVAIGRIVNPGGKAILAGLRKESDPTILAAVAFATGQIGAAEMRNKVNDPDAATWLGTLLSAPGTSPLVAREAARSLGKIKSPEARAALLRFAATAPVTEAAAPVVGEALLSLGRFAGRDDVAPILRWATSPDVEVRWRATWALFRLRDPGGIPELMRLATDRSPEVRYWAVRGLAPAVVDEAKSDRAAASALLARATRDGDRRVRTEALRALGAYGDDTAFAAVVEALGSKDNWLAISAAEAAASFKTRGPELLGPLTVATGRNQPASLRMAALTPLVTFGPERAIDVAAELAEHSSAVVRAVGRTALGKTLGEDGKARLAALAARQPAAPAPPAAPATPPPVRTLADYRAIVEQWVVPEYRGARRPRTIWETPRGTIEIELNPGEAPLAVDNLVRNVESGDIIGTEFGRVVPNFVAQQQGIRNAARLRDEVNQLGLLRGTLSWASSGLDTGRPGYTLGNTPQPHNEGDFTALGRVVSGMDVVDRLELGDAVTAARIRR